MKSDWSIKHLHEVCTFKPAKAEAKATLSETDEVSFAPMDDLGINRKYLEPSSTRLLADVAGSYTYFANGDVLLAKITPCFENGKLGIAHNLVNGVGFGSSEYFVIRPHPELAAEYLYYFFLQQSFREQGAKSMTGAVGHKRVTKDFLETFKLPVPPLVEQHRLIAIFDKAFDSIAKARANAEKNVQNARELFESHLQSKLSKQPGWEGKTLRQVSLDFGRGKSKHRPRNDPKLYGGPYPFIQTGDVRGCEHLITEFTQTYSEAGLAQSKLWPKGTLCITIAANIAETGILGFDSCFPDSVIGVVVDPKQTSNSFLEYLLQSVKASLKAKGKGSAQDNINLATFENEPFYFPDLTVQKQIVGQLSDLNAEVQRLESIYQQKLAALDELKQSLLHQAFSGNL
ncbi:restriction endonuclease subunit S [Ectopseudomonas oleovorans]|uniref:Restriction endonuclease subunit S n=1 Tax=Ectopseudomonas oleovorans TaxID=301 RepID=A0A3R8XWU4_ECTOL|nr:restriction endonuclease subunit S [Pseudomonas oleovorans]RRW37584.1 restriction endonuclease subunit S [Pseudomonas oleovorans]